MAKKEKAEDYGNELEKAFAQWASLYEHGCTDPSWPDGVNMNLVRNHIAYYKNKIIETMAPENYPAVFHYPGPPEVDDNYFARAEEIRCVAIRDLEGYKQDANLQFLRQRYDFIHKQDREKLRLDALLWRFMGLEKAVREDDLQVMRRKRDVTEDLADFASCAATIKDLSPERMIQAVQISLF